MTAAESHTSPCRRCADCVNQDHHWLEHCDDPEDLETRDSTWCGYECKHCPARAELCAHCDGPVWPADEVARETGLCGECLDEIRSAYEAPAEAEDDGQLNLFSETRS